MMFLYNIVIHLYGFLISIVSLFNSKAKQWKQGRVDWKHNVYKFKQAHSDKDIIWFHCSSLGEFEQARTLIDELYDLQKYYLVVSFFSPSGYTYRKNYSKAHFVFYLPLDTKHNSRELVKLLSPTLVLFTKYDLWYNLINQLHKAGVKQILFSSLFRSGQIYFKPILKSFYSGLFSKFHFISTQNNESKQLLSSLNVRATVLPDTRYDRVFQILNVPRETNEVALFKGNSKLLVCGSTWPIDEYYISKIMRNFQGLKVLVVPHNINAESISKTVEVFDFHNTEIFSSFANSNANVMIMDNVGLLSSLYQYADIVYVGGGFGSAVHNTLEPAVWGKPIIVGPNNKKFYEVQLLKSSGGLFQVNTYEEMLEKISTLLSLDELDLLRIGVNNKKLIESNIGSTNKILMEINTILNS